MERLDSELADPEPGPENQHQNATAGSAGRDRPRQVPGWLALGSARIRLALIVLAAGLAAALLWPSGNTGENLPDRADRAPEAVPVVAASDRLLQLNLATPAETPAAQADQIIAPAPPGPSVALPASAALAISAKPDQEGAAPGSLTGDSPTTDDATAVAPASGSVIPVNVPSSETAPPAGDVSPAQEIPATIPKSVSPVPVPRPRPELAAAQAGRYAVQLASVAIEKKATQEAFRLQKQLGPILGGREIQVEKAVVKGKGTRYRLRASGYRTQAEANAVCAQVARLKVNCLAIRR